MSERTPDVEMGAQDFSPGFLDTPEPDTLPPGSSPDAKNCLLVHQETQDEQRATLRRRLGCRLINPTAIASGKSIDGLWQFDREGAASELVVLCNGALYTWDGATTFNAITDGSGFTAGTPGHATAFKNNLLVTDGTVQKRYDGTAAFDIGFAAPTAAPALATAAGPGVTGDYEGYAVWVDATTGHPSSPSATSSLVTFANQQRAWTKPAGSPPTNVTHWRIYCRRSDTNEVNFFRTGTDQTVATATYTEAVADDLRRDKGPLDAANNPPPVFDHMEEWKQYRLAVLPNGSNLYISALGDAESQDPSDVFLVGGRGDAKNIRAIRKFGQNVYLRKPTKAYTLVGDKVPFQIVPASESYGAVSHESGVEIDGAWYDWDEQRGPYVTDMSSTFEPLADARIKTIVSTVNQIALPTIRAVHAQAYNLILWAVPTTVSRKRTLLAYNYRLKRWLPPVTGFEYTALTAFTTSAGAQGVYFGDEWGRVYELFSGEVDGVPSGTTMAPITGATGSTITAASATFYTTGSGLAGMPVAVRSPAGAWQFVRALSNTGTVLTLDTTNGPTLNPVPAADGTWEVVVGAIEWYWTTPRLTGGNRRLEKRGWGIWIEGGSAGPTDDLEVRVRYNRSRANAMTYTLRFPALGLVWGSGNWGDPFGTGGERAMRKHRLNQSFFDIQLQFANYYPGEWFEITSYLVTADVLSRRTVLSA